MDSDASPKAAENVDAVGFWLSFVLMVAVSAVEALASVIWTRIRVDSSLTAEGYVLHEHSIRVCGHKIQNRMVDDVAALQIAEGRGVCGYTTVETHNSSTVINHFASISFIPTIAIRRFNPSTSLEGASNLVENLMKLFRKDSDIFVGDFLEIIIDILFVLADISLGIAGLVLIPDSPQKLWDTLLDATAPMTFENYLTLLFLWWILGALLLVAMLPMHSQWRSIRWIGCPAVVATFIAYTADFVLFGLGCWKIDYARRNGLDWTPMLSYWIAGAAAINLPCCSVIADITDTFGLVGLVFMILDTF